MTVSKTSNSQRFQTLSSSIELLPDELTINGVKCYLRIKRKAGENGKSGWFIRYLTPVKFSVNENVYYQVILQQRSEKLEKGATLMLNKIKKITQ